MIKPYTPIFHLPAGALPQLEEAALVAFNLSQALHASGEALARLFRGSGHFIFHADAAAFPLTKEGGHRLNSAVVSTRYRKRGNRVVILTSSDTPYDALPQLEKAFEEQGWSGCSYLSTYADAPLTEVEFVPEAGLNDGAEAVSIFTNCLNNGGNYIVFRGSESNARQVENTFFQNLQHLFASQPTCGAVIHSYWDLKQKHQACTESLSAANEQLGIAETFVSLAKSKYKDDYDLLFNHYQTQYEVLPLWYKRFGHIVKVLTGKRTLRSLFKHEPKNPTA